MFFFQKINNEGLSTHKGYRTPQKIYAKNLKKFPQKWDGKNPKSTKKRKIQKNVLNNQNQTLKIQKILKKSFLKVKKNPENPDLSQFRI